LPGICGSSKPRRNILSTRVMWKTAKGAGYQFVMSRALRSIIQGGGVRWDGSQRESVLAEKLVIICAAQPATHNQGKLE